MANEINLQFSATFTAGNVTGISRSYSSSPDKADGNFILTVQDVDDSANQLLDIGSLDDEGVYVMANIGEEDAIVGTNNDKTGDFALLKAGEFLPWRPNGTGNTPYLWCLAGLSTEIELLYMPD